MFNFAGVIINSSSIALDRIFTYSIPDILIDKALIGTRIMVPFGKGNKKVEGFVVQLFSLEEKPSGVKDIEYLLNDFPLFTKEDLEMVGIMREKYLCTWLEGIKVLIPSGITKGMKEKKEMLIYTGKKLDGKFNKEPYLRIYGTVAQNNGAFNKSSLSLNEGLSPSSISTLLKHGFLVQQEEVVGRYNKRTFSPYDEKRLTPVQEEIVDGILHSKENMFLIHGVTGSGKTEIYMQLAARMMKSDKSSIILVPEISLTPQMVERFKGRFGSEVSVFHSRLSMGERYDEWLRVKEGRVKVAIGARSAIFLPFNNLGLIVVDEEHESSYKSDSDPKYDAREIAEIKSVLLGCKVVLGSATPSLESYHRAVKGQIKLYTINERADGAKMPKFNIVDMREELKSNNRSIFSGQLLQSIEKCLLNKEQVILFLNRRGFSTFVSCRSCGFVFKCENCDISLTYHSENNMLTCHYCGKAHHFKRVCPKCGSKYVKYFGIGTERIEEEIKKHFPSAITLRMDYDTTRKKNSHEKIYSKFKNMEADILIGTQMIAKGLDFSNVTLVGIIAADLSLNLPDFRASERTFQLITQVSGRAGRGKKSGKVVVQTYCPENYSIKYAVGNDYESFYNEEIKIRASMNYPPFSKLLSINMSSENEEMLIKSIQNIGVILKNKVDNYDKIDMLGPNPCLISKIKKQYRWQIVFKGDISTDFATSIRKTIYDLTKDVYNSIRISIDINPSSLL